MGELETQTKTSVQVILLDAEDIIENCLNTIGKQVSCTDHLIIWSSNRKQNKAGYLVNEDEQDGEKIALYGVEIASITKVSLTILIRYLL